MGNDNIMLVLQEAVRTALNEAANEKIKEHREQFEREMVTAKREIVGRLVNQIQIMASQSPLNSEYVIQIRLNGGAENGRCKEM